MANHVFITHAVEDKKTANLVCEFLERNGIRCWIAPRDVPYGMNFEEAIIDAISKSSMMILILSASSNKSPHVTREIQNAFIGDAQTRVLPFRVDSTGLNSTLQYYLGSTQWLDASTPPVESHLDNLVKRVRVYLPPEEDVDAGRKAEAEAARKRAEAARKAEAEAARQRAEAETQEPDQRTVEPLPFSAYDQPVQQPNRRIWYIAGGAVLAVAIIVVAAVAYTTIPSKSPEIVTSASPQPTSTPIDQVSGNTGITNPPVNSAPVTNTATPSPTTARPSPSIVRPSTEQIVTVQEPPPSPSPSPTPPTTRQIAGGVLNGKAINLPKPNYPPMARAVRASGLVVVRVVIDENGNVTSAETISGHPLLQAAAAAAARQAKFSPTKLSGQPVKVSGVLQYTFVAPQPSPSATP